MFSLAFQVFFFIKSNHLVPWFIAFLVSNIKSILPWYSNLKLIRQIIRKPTNNFLSSKHNKWFFPCCFWVLYFPNLPKFLICIPLEAAVEDNFIPNIRMFMGALFTKCVDWNLTWTEDMRIKIVHMLKNTWNENTWNMFWLYWVLIQYIYEYYAE